MNNFKKVSVIVFTLSLLVLMCQSVSYSAQISRAVIYDATINPFGKIDKEIVFPENHDPFYLHVSFLLSPGTITADLSGDVIFDQNNGTIMLRGSRGNLGTDGGINFKGSIEIDFVIPVNFYTLLFASPGLALVDWVFDLPEIEVPVKGSVTVFDLGPHWRDSESFNSFLLNGESVKVTAGVRDILSKKLSAVDLAGIIVTATTGIPPIAVDVAEDIIKIGLGDSRISLNAGLTSNLTLSGEAIIVNGQRVVREGQSIAAPGLDRSRNSYEVNTTYVENFTTVLDLLFSADIELLFNPLGIEMWEYDEPIAELPINVVPERTRELEFRTTPETIVFPIEQTSANRSPQREGSINVRPLTVGGSAARADVSPYFSDPDNDRLTYSARSRNTSAATVSISGSEVIITPRSEGRTDITITATDPGGLTARQTVTVTVQAEHGCEYTLSESSQDVLAAGGSLDVYVTTTSGCDWRATTNSGFLSVKPSRGIGSGAVTVTVAENTRTRSRTGRLTIAGETFTVRQDGVRTIVSQELSRGDAVIVQNTLHLGLNIRSGASTNHPKIGGVFDGATGTVVDGPRRANGYKWWKVDWDNAPMGWSVEAIDEDLLILRRPPDLAIESFDVSENRLDPGEEFTLSVTIRNVGYNSSEEADLYYHHTSAPAFTSTADLTMVGTDTVRGLSPNRTSDESIRVKAPLTPGTYYYAAAVIASDDDPNIVNNFVSSKERVTVSRPTFPDLVVSFSVNEDTLAPRERFTLSATVRNRGAEESRSTKLRYYRSSNSTISTDDTQVETDGVSSLDPDETDDESVTLRAPGEGGVYYYGACVDSVRNESDTGNNCSDGVRVTIRSPDRSPDLLVENVQVSDSILTSGSSFRVSATVRNRSADSSDSTRLRYYRSSDSTISTGDTEVGTDGVSSISSDGTRDETKTLTAPSEAGTYYYGACVDRVRGESKTGNNCSDGIPVVVRAPLNQAPEAVGTVPPQTLTEDGSAANVGVSRNFYDPDYDSLTYTATSDNTSVATVSVSDALVTITPQNAGRATITVTVSDGTLTTTQDITVTVDAAPRVAHALEKISGDNQQGPPGEPLLSPFIVEVRDTENRGLEGVDVTFAVTAGDGTVSEITVTTDANGQAASWLILGGQPGMHTVQASVEGISEPVIFNAVIESAAPRVAHALGKISGDNQQGPAGATLEDPLIVEVRDVANRGLEGVDVTFAVTAGDGTVSEITVTTDANGQAASWLILGGQPGMHTVQASVEGISEPVIFNATIESAAPRVAHALGKISGDNQQGPPGEPLLSPFIVEVRDTENRGLEGVDVTFAVTAGDGTVSEITVTTDANGQAASWLILGGQPGMHTVQASVEGISEPVIFNATIESMEFDLSVPSGTSLIHVPLRVTAVDGVAQSIESISDLYNTLGGASTVNFLLTYDPTTQDWLSYFGTFNTGRSADKVLTDDLGILASMQVPVTIRLRGNALGTDERSTITLNQGRNLVGLPLRDPRITRVSDLLALEGIGGNVPVVILNDNGEFKTVGRAGDPGDIPITGGQGFILTAQQAATVAISGGGWTNVLGTTAAPPVTLKGIGVGDTTPVLGLRGSIADEGTGLKVEGFRVTVKNLSTGRAISGITGGERGGYQLTVVDTETGRAATIGDILEISAQSPNLFIGVRPLQYTVTAKDVKRSQIQLPILVAYEIPAETQLLANYPNPFNPETWIPYRLAEDAFVRLTIYDQTGKVVRTLDVGHRVAAVYESRSKAIYWDGRNEVGESVASGVYFYHLSAGDYSATRKMLIVK